MGKVFVLDHPLIQHKLSMLRDKDTGNKEFRELVREIAEMTFYEAVRDTSLIDIEVETPMEKTMCKQIEKKFGVVLILRAGIGMVDGIINLMPTAKIGHIGLYRDPETLLPVEYYCKLPYDASEREILLLDPMLATGGTAVAAIDFLRERGVNNIKLLSIISCPEGIARVQNDHPDVDIYTSTIDKGLNDHGYIIPGLGDAGDRLFGTK